MLAETTKQISVFLENKPGRLTNVLSAFSREKVNITGMTIMDSHEHTVLRVVAENVDRMRQVMKGLGMPYAETDVLLVELRNQPGALAHVCEALAENHIAIEYAYCSSGGRNGKTFGVFRVSHNDKAIKVIGTGNNNKVATRRMGRRPIHTRN